MNYTFTLRAKSRENHINTSLNIIIQGTPVITKLSGPQLYFVTLQLDNSLYPSYNGVLVSTITANRNVPESSPCTLSAPVWVRYPVA